MIYKKETAICCIMVAAGVWAILQCTSRPIDCLSRNIKKECSIVRIDSSDPIYTACCAIQLSSGVQFERHVLALSILLESQTDTSLSKLKSYIDEFVSATASV